jgi:hypothetical protein
MRIRPRDALLVVPLLGVMGVLAGEFSSSSVVTAVSLAISATAIALYLAIGWVRSSRGG